MNEERKKQKKRKREVSTKDEQDENGEKKAKKARPNYFVAVQVSNIKVRSLSVLFEHVL